VPVSGSGCAVSTEQDGKLSLAAQHEPHEKPWDNAVIESVFSTLTHELLDRKRYGDPDRAQRSITECIDDFYNAQRRHTALGNMSPIKYELACQMRKRRT